MIQRSSAQYASAARIGNRPRLKSGSMLLADRGYDAGWIRELAMKKGLNESRPRMT